MNCRLCQSENCSLYGSDTQRDYIVCSNCQLIFVPDIHCITIEKERERYNLHNNTAAHEAYNEYLANFLKELDRIPVPKPKVLDFGSGKEAVLTEILMEKGISCSAYDPLYNIGLEALDAAFDIVILCEVIEHVRNIEQELQLIDKVLDTKGYLLMKTELYRKDTDFSTWWYTKDSTHINFLSILTMMKIAELLKRDVFYTNNKNIVIIH